MQYFLKTEQSSSSVSNVVMKLRTISLELKKYIFESSGVAARCIAEKLFALPRRVIRFLPLGMTG